MYVTEYINVNDMLQAGRDQKTTTPKLQPT